MRARQGDRPEVTVDPEPPSHRCHPQSLAALQRARQQHSVGAAAARRNTGLSQGGGNQENVYKMKTRWGCPSFVWKTKKRSKQETGIGSQRIIMPEFPRCLFWRLSFNPQLFFL